MKLKWIAMAGMRGYMPNICEEYDSKKDAIESLCQVHDNQRGLKTELRRYGYSEKCAGNEYCEVYAVVPKWHGLNAQSERVRMARAINPLLTYLHFEK